MYEEPWWNKSSGWLYIPTSDIVSSWSNTGQQGLWRDCSAVSSTARTGKGADHGGGHGGLHVVEHHCDDKSLVCRLEVFIAEV